MIDTTEVEMFERSVRQATERHTGEALDGALTELGWREALAEDAYTAVSILFPLQGAANGVSSALDQVMATGLALQLTTEAVVLPRLGTWAPPGAVTDERVAIRGLGTQSLQHCDRAVVVAHHGGADTFTIGTVATSDVDLRPVGGMDPHFGLIEATADGVDFSSYPDGSGATWGAAVVLARLALSYEILGAARTVLSLAREHALDRVQYGRPISRFQAVRHRLAEALVAIEGADAVVTAARETPSTQLAAMAKALAGRGALTAARHCQQVLAGIGFTAEHPFHRSFRRILLLDQLFGSAHSLTSELGDELLRSRRLPVLLPL